MDRHCSNATAIAHYLNDHAAVDTVYYPGLEGHPGHDIALAQIVLNRPVAVDAFATLAETGSFVVVDALTGATVAGGVIDAARAHARRAPLTPAKTDASEKVSGYVLSRAQLAAGLCADLGESAADKIEFERRRQEVLKILAQAGVAVRP